MVDPLSITTGVLALAGQCVKGLDIIHKYSSEFRKAELNVRLLSTECKVLTVVLEELRTLYAGRTQVVRGNMSRPDGNTKDDGIRTVLAECDQQLRILAGKLEPFIQLATSSTSNEMTLRARISATWNREDIDIPRQCIQRQVNLVSLLLTTLQQYVLPVHMQLGEFINSSPEVQDLLKKSKDDTKSLRTAHEMERSLYYATARSGYAAEGTEAESIMGDEEFTFDPEIINTPAYRRAFQSRRRAISSERHYIEPVTPLPPASTSGAKESSPRLSRLFSGTSNKREFKTSSSSIATGATTDAAQASMISSTLVEPVGDAVIRGDEAVTATTVRNARSKFYDAMALHREILAMKFVDQSYQSVVEQKVQTRNAVLEELQRALSLDTGFTVEEDRLVKELKYVLLPKLTGDLQQSSGAISGI
ncbi:hypothetical protein V8F33_004588 [Rhypophila sp. PSN 637]